MTTLEAKPVRDQADVRSAVDEKLGRGEALMSIVPLVWDQALETAGPVFKALVERWPDSAELDDFEVTAPRLRASSSPPPQTSPKRQRCLRYGATARPMKSLKPSTQRWARPRIDSPKC